MFCRKGRVFALFCSRECPFILPAFADTATLARVTEASYLSQGKHLKSHQEAIVLISADLLKSAGPSTAESPADEIVKNQVVMSNIENRPKWRPWSRSQRDESADWPLCKFSQFPRGVSLSLLSDKR